MKRKIPKQRNEVVVNLIKRAGAGSGVHSKSQKAIRAREKVKLRKEVNE